MILKAEIITELSKKGLDIHLFWSLFGRLIFPGYLCISCCVSISTEPATHVADGEGLDQKAGGAGKDACRCLFLCVFLFLVFFFFGFLRVFLAILR